MKKYNLTILAVFCFILGISIALSKITSAAGEFRTEYLVDYNISTSGETQVNYDVTIINTQSDVLATKYSLSLKQMNIYDVSGTDKGGQMKITTETIDDTTTITATLNDQAIGQNKKNNLKIKFKTKNIALKVGEVWNINIPRIQNLESTNKYDVTLGVPSSFGPTIFVSPQSEEQTNSLGQKVYKFTKESLIDKGITASFGKYQILNYQLRYQLKNNSSFTSTQEVALPPDLKDQQQMFYNTLVPAPVNVKTDADGNILARYKLRGKESMEITLTGSARIMGKQIIPEFGGKIDQLPKDLVNRFTKEQKYWEIKSPEIQAISNTLFKKDETVSQNAQYVYNFVIQNLSYDFEAAKNPTIERKGAQQILNLRDKAACMEFTDLFIALTRAMGIPSRELNGYALGNSDNTTPISINLKGGDLLHAWPEFYDPNYGWIAVDPTWGNTSKMDYFTKLDTNHFVFVVKGINSEYPFPAGIYRTDDNTKLIDISFAYEQTPPKNENLSALDQAKGFVQKEPTPFLTIFIICGFSFTALATLYFFIFKRRHSKQQT